MHCRSTYFLKSGCDEDWEDLMWIYLKFFLWFVTLEQARKASWFKFYIQIQCGNQRIIVNIAVRCSTTRYHGVFLTFMKMTFLPFMFVDKFSASQKKKKRRDIIYLVMNLNLLPIQITIFITGIRCSLWTDARLCSPIEIELFALYMCNLFFFLQWNNTSDQQRSINFRTVHPEWYV